MAQNCELRTHRGARLLILSLGVVALATVGDVSAQQPPSEPQRVLHVNQHHPLSSDQSNGSEDTPYRTIQAAARHALELRAQGQSVKVAIHRGTYRESVSISEPTLRPDAPLFVIEGVESDVIISGADPLSVRGPDSTGALSILWPNRWGLADIPDGWDPVAAHLMAHPVVLRAEMVFVGGALLQQVVSADELHAGDGRFFVEESPSDLVPGTIWWTPRAGDQTVVPDAVEVAIRPRLFSANRIGNLVVRGITFCHAATRLQEAAVHITSSANVVFEDVRVEWNSWNGLGVYESQDVTLRRIASNDNGAGGVTGWRVRRLVVEDVETSYNNWRGGWGDFTGWATGQKFSSVHGARFSRFQAVGNWTTGLWFDTDVADIVVEESRLCQNVTRGLYIQAVQGPAMIRDSVICGNGQIGVLATAAAGVTLERNAITGNGDHQVVLPWRASDHVVSFERDYESGETMAIRSERWTMSRNVIEGKGQSLLFSVGDWPEFLTTLQSDENQWLHSFRRDVLGLYREPNAPPERTDIEGWRALSRQDRSSPFIYVYDELSP